MPLEMQLVRDLLEKPTPHSESCVIQVSHIEDVSELSFERLKQDADCYFFIFASFLPMFESN
jgi:hypothetical protein